MVVVHTVMSKRARLARAIGGHGLGLPLKRPPKEYILTREQKLMARKMSRRNGSLDQYIEAIGWTHGRDTLRRKLADIGVRFGAFRPHSRNLQRRP